MSRDIFIRPGDITSGLLKNTRQQLETASEKLKGIDRYPVYYGPDGYAQLYPSSVLSQIFSLAAQINSLEDKLSKYSQVANSGPDALAEIDGSCKNQLTSVWDRIGYRFGDAINPILQGTVGVFSLLFCTGNNTAHVTEVYSNNGRTTSEQNSSTEKLDEVSYADKRKTISAYEANHPEASKKLNDYLNDTGLSDSDVENIKYLVYTAPEPYRSLYMEHAESYKLRLKDDRADHNILTNTTSLDRDFTSKGDHYLSNDPRTPYTSFFHESGHAVDDFERSGLEFTSKMAYRSSKYSHHGKTMFECITDDVRSNVSDYINTTYSDLTETQKNTLLRSMNLTDDADFVYKGRNNGLSDPYLDEIRTGILDHYIYEEFEGYDNAAVCDIYGGITNEVFLDESVYKSGVYQGHAGKSEYWYTKTINLGYWDKNYDKATGEFTYDMEHQTGKQAAELWAEFFAAQMTRNEAALANIKDHFPTAYEAMEQMAQDMTSGS